MHPRESGRKGEFEFIRRLNAKGIPYEYTDDWCDFTILGQEIDVKTAVLSHKFTGRSKNRQQYKIGRFTLTEEQRERSLWLALFVRHDDEFLFLGFTKSKKNSSRYISIHKTRELPILTLEEFVAKYSKKNGK